MTAKELARLERLAKAATPGQWVKDCPVYSGPWMVGVVSEWSEEPVREVICSLDVRYGNAADAPRALDLHYKQVMADAAFIAAAGPQTVLKLVAEIRRLRVIRN